MDKLNEKIFDAYEKSILDEKAMLSANPVSIADDLARLIMGDHKMSLRFLEKKLPIANFNIDSSTYNKAYAQLYKDMKSAIEKALKVAKSEE